MEAGVYEKLRCPGCRGALTLDAFGESEHDGHRYVESGLLLCGRCRVSYPVESGTPVMLRFRTAFHDRFAASHAQRLSPHAGHPFPSEDPRPGELAVQETFTDEWNLTREDELSFTFTFEE